MSISMRSDHPIASERRTRRSRWPSCVVGLLAGALALPAWSQIESMLGDPNFPRRAPGLWEVRSASSSVIGLPPTLNCVGDGTDGSRSQLDRSPGAKGSCTLGSFTRVGEAWVAESVCKEGRTRVTSKAIATGDFRSHYRIDTAVTYDPPLGGVKKEDKDAIVARHLGACPAHQKPGDLVVPGMGTLNMIDGTFRAEPSPAARPPARRKATDKTSSVKGQGFARDTSALTFISEVDNGS